MFASYFRVEQNKKANSKKIRFISRLKESRVCQLKNLVNSSATETISTTILLE